MALEEERNSRDYLYGRLLAVAEKIESMALIACQRKSGNNSSTADATICRQTFLNLANILRKPYTVQGHGYNAKYPGLLNGYDGVD